MAANLIKPLKDSSEGYEEPVNPATDGLSSAGFYPQNSTNDQAAGIERDGSGNLVLKDGITGTKTLADLIGITEAAHRALRQLIHFIDDGPADGFASGAYCEVTPTGPLPTTSIWYTSVAKTHKIVDEIITYNGNKTIATSQWRVYGVDGSTVLATVSDSISYSGVFETNRTRTIT